MDATYEGLDHPEKDQPVEKETVVDYTNLLAGFWIRFWAYLIDLIVIGSINRILVYPLLQLIGIDTNDSYIFSVVSNITAITFFAYFVIMTKLLKQTLGKMVFGLKVVSTKGEENLNWGTILFRELIGRYISKMIWVGYVIAAFTPKKQALHDIFADTLVIHEKVFSKSIKEEPVV